MTAPLPKTSLLPELWLKISKHVNEVDALLRLTCVNKSMKDWTTAAIKRAQLSDELNFAYVLECFKLELTYQVACGIFFVEVGSFREPGGPVVARGYEGYSVSYDDIITLSVSSEGHHVFEPTTLLARLSARNNRVKTRGGLTFRFPGEIEVEEIESLVTMNDTGIDTIVLRSLDGKKMISNLDHGGLDLPSGAGIANLLSLFDREAGYHYWLAQGPSATDHMTFCQWRQWTLDDLDSEVMSSSEQEIDEVDDTGEDEADCFIVEEPEEDDCFIVERCD
jgi:hypothetical protein